MDDFDFSSFLTDASTLGDPHFNADAFLALPQPFQDQGSTSSSSSSNDASPASLNVQQEQANYVKLRNCAACRIRR